jgi:biotin synthase
MSCNFKENSCASSDTSNTELHYNWSKEDLEKIYALPFPDLMLQALTLHKKYFPNNEVQRSTLLSIKTGGCSEDCAYCPQSVHHENDLERHKLLPIDEVLNSAKEAKKSGSTRFCMGAAWRQVKDGEDFDSILNMVKGVSNLGMEVCCTLGMLNENQAQRLKEAGCYAYNHNLDTSPEYYGEIISTRTYADRISTIKNVRKAGITLCCGGIIGMGESVADRIELIHQLANMKPHPESVPINMLVRIEGTPLQYCKPVDPLEFVRIIALARITMPKSMVRLSAGRTEMSKEMQALCFLAGANSIFAGDKLLTTPNPGEDVDNSLMKNLGMGFLENCATGTCSSGTNKETRVMPD